MLWFKFFKSKIPQIGVFLLMSAIYIVTFWLWHLPMMAFVNSTLFAVIIPCIRQSNHIFFAVLAQNILFESASPSKKVAISGFLAPFSKITKAVKTTSYRDETTSYRLNRTT